MTNGYFDRYENRVRLMSLSQLRAEMRELEPRTDNRITLAFMDAEREIVQKYLALREKEENEKIS